MLHAFTFAAVPKNFGSFRIGKFNLKGQTSTKLNLVKEQLNRIGGRHAEGGEDSFCLGFDSRSNPGTDGGGF